MKCIIGRCYLILAILLFSIASAYAQTPTSPVIQDNIKQVSQSDTLSQNIAKNGIPLGLFAYNKWVDLNENGEVERNEFFGLGKEFFSKGEALSASLYDPDIPKGNKLKLRIWDTSGNLIRTVRKLYSAIPLFTYSNFDSFLPVGDYILTINPEGLGKTYQINFSLKEPTGKAFLKIRKKLLPENFYLFKEWIDEDGDMKMDSAEVLGLNNNQFELGNVDLQVGLNLPMSRKKVVYQIWNSKYDLIAMNIAKMDSLQHYTMQEDSLHKGNQFLRVLQSVPAGEYLITASLSGDEPRQYRLLVQINDTLASLTRQETEQPETELLVVEDSIPVMPAAKKVEPIQVDNMAPKFNKGQEGFFLFTGFIDMNENNKQERNEFMGADQEYYYSASENVFVQFHLPQFANSQLDLKLFDEGEQLVSEQIGDYAETPFVFKISMPDEPLSPGSYQLIVKPGESEVKYRLELEIK